MIGRHRHIDSPIHKFALGQTQRPWESVTPTTQATESYTPLHIETIHSHGELKPALSIHLSVQHHKHTMSSLSHQQASNDKATENPNVNAEEQMETLSEGKVADAVEKKSGAQTAPGENVVFDDFSSDIGR